MIGRDELYTQGGPTLGADAKSWLLMLRTQPYDRQVFRGGTRVYQLWHFPTERRGKVNSACRDQRYSMV